MWERRANYGLDAPPVVSVQLAIGVIGIVAAGAVAQFSPRPWAVSLAIPSALIGANCLACATGMIWYSRIGKLRQRDRLLDPIQWRGDEKVLDVGCGRGLMLIGAARRLTGGKAIGIDLWRAGNLTGNSPGATLRNAKAEGVADRVQVQGADARRLPFADGSFDIVVSSLALHNISQAAERRQAVREIVRVLKSGGRVAMIDIQHTGEYVRVLHDAGFADARRTTAGKLFFLYFALLSWGNLRYFQVTGTKRSAI